MQWNSTVLTTMAFALVTYSMPVVAKQPQARPQQAQAPMQPQNPYAQPVAYAPAAPDYYDSRSEVRGKRAPDTSPEIKLEYGKVFGINSLVKDGAANLFGAELLTRLTPNVFVPISVSRWEAPIDIGPEYEGMITGSMRMLQLETGIGYDMKVNNKFKFPVGLRAGWYEMGVDLNIVDYGTFHAAMYGKSLAPFAGMAYSPSRKYSFGYEARMPMIYPHEKSDNSEESSDDENEKDTKSNSYFTYHLLAFSLKL